MASLQSTRAYPPPAFVAGSSGRQGMMKPSPDISRLRASKVATREPGLSHTIRTRDQPAKCGNDLTEISLRDGTKMALYADDVLLFRVINPPEDFAKLQDDIEKNCSSETDVSGGLLPVSSLANYR